MFKAIFLISMGLINLGLIGFFYIISIKWVKKIQVMEKKIYQLQKIIRGLQMADMRFNRKVDELQQETEQLSTNTEPQVSQALPHQEKYHYALKLLQSGMHLEEVMEACQIGRAEAELLQNLDGYKRFAKKDKSFS